MLVAKTKALISFAGTAKLIWAFVFAYAKCWFSHDAAHLIMVISLKFQLGCLLKSDTEQFKLQSVKSQNRLLHLKKVSV